MLHKYEAQEAHNFINLMSDVLLGEVWKKFFGSDFSIALQQIEFTLGL